MQSVISPGELDTTLLRFSSRSDNRQHPIVVLGNLNLSEIIRFAKALKGLANPMLGVLFLFLSTLFSVCRSRRSPSGDLGAATPDRCAPALFQTAELDRGGPRLLGVVVRSLDRLAIGTGHRQTSDGHRLAP